MVRDQVQKGSEEASVSPRLYSHPGSQGDTNSTGCWTSFYELHLDENKNEPFATVLLGHRVLRCLKALG